MDRLKGTVATQTVRVQPGRLPSALVCALLALAAAEPALGGETRPTTINELRAFTERSLGRARVRGASVALVRGGDLVWLESFGVKDERSGEAATPDTVFEAASLGKVVAAYAALLLVEEGRWSLDMPASAPALSVDPGCEAPSLLHLLSHTAGLSNNLGAKRYQADCTPVPPSPTPGRAISSCSISSKQKPASAPSA